MILKKNYKRILGILLLFLLTFQFLASTFPMRAAAAAPYAESFDSSRIEDDLAGVDLSNYPKNPMGDCDIISFMEYAYSNKSYLDEYFGVYIYVYNPTGRSIVKQSEYNTVNFGWYGEDGSIKYESVKLEYLDNTTDNLFYKFKLSRASEILAMSRRYAAANDGKRVYELIDIQVMHGIERSHADISKKYQWEGFAAYCGDDSASDSTLTCTDFGVRSIHLNLTHALYRYKMNTSWNDLNSIFFSVPEEYFQEFGNLCEASAEWYEYKTSEMFVTSDLDAFSALWNMRNIRINKFGQKIDENGTVIDDTVQTYYRVFWNEWQEQKIIDNVGPTPFWVTYFGDAYNAQCRDDIDDDTTLEEFFAMGSGRYGLSPGYDSLDRLDWLFYTSDTKGENAYKISKNQVIEYMKSYTSQFPYQERIRGKYAENLFSSSIDYSRLKYLDANRQKDSEGNYLVDSNGKPIWSKNETSGYVKMNFTVNEDFDPNVGNYIVKYEKNNKDWIDWLFGGYSYVREDFAPLVVIHEPDLYLTEEAFSEKYYIGMQDVGNIMTEAKRSYSKNERPVLLRFAVTDYVVTEARFDSAEADKFDMSEVDGYVAQETVFLDFDVLSLAFCDEENGYNYVVIGVVAEPIDIINGLTPPTSLEDEEWWQKLVALLLVIIVFNIVSVLINTYVPWLGAIFRGFFKGIVWILKQLFRLLTYPFRAIGKKVKHKANIRSCHKLSSSRSKSRTSKSKGKRGKYGKQKISSK